MAEEQQPKDNGKGKASGDGSSGDKPSSSRAGQKSEKMSEEEIMKMLKKMGLTGNVRSVPCLSSSFGGYRLTNAGCQPKQDAAGHEQVPVLANPARTFIW